MQFYMFQCARTEMAADAALKVVMEHLPKKEVKAVQKSFPSHHTHKKGNHQRRGSAIPLHDRQ